MTPQPYAWWDWCRALDGTAACAQGCDLLALGAGVGQQLVRPDLQLPQLLWQPPRQGCAGEGHRCFYRRLHHRTDALSDRCGLHFLLTDPICPSKVCCLCFPAGSRAFPPACPADLQRLQAEAGCRSCCRLPSVSSPASFRGPDGCLSPFPLIIPSKPLLSQRLPQLP